MLNMKWVKKGVIFIIISAFLMTMLGCEKQDNTVNTKVQKSESFQIGREYLSVESQEVYDLVGRAVTSFTSEIEAEGLDQKEMKKVIEYYRADHPEVFWLYENYAYEYDTFHEKISSLRFTYAYQNQTSGEIVNHQKEAVNRMKMELEEQTAVILSEISPDMSEYEKVKYLHDYLATHISYDKTGDFQHNIYGAIVEERAVCDGISRAFQYLAGKLGIESRVAYGCSSDGIPHAWNVVKVGENYYHLDITWDMPQERGKSPSYLYFNASDEQVLENRIIFSPREGENAESYHHYIPIPRCSNTDYYYYSYENLQITDYQKEGMEQLFKIIDRKIKEKKNEVQLLFYGKKDYADFLQDILKPGTEQERWNCFLQQRGILFYQISENPEYRLIVLEWKAES